MKTAYENELRSLQSWINNVNTGLTAGETIVIDLASANNTCNQIKAVVNGVGVNILFMPQSLKIYL